MDWWQERAACCTGEEVEQINSYVSRCGSTAKHMCPERLETQFTLFCILGHSRIQTLQCICRNKKPKYLSLILI